MLLKGLVVNNQVCIEKMVEQIEQGDFSGAMKIHREWANKDFWGCFDGIAQVEAETGNAYGQYHEYFIANL